MTEILITTARPRDIACLQKLIRDLAAFHGDVADVTLEQIQSIFFGPRPSGRAFLAHIAEKPVGYAAVLETVTLITAMPRFDIHHLFVVDGQRNLGIGRALIAAAKDYAAARGAGGLTIGTDARNASAPAAYRAMGLVEITTTGPRFWIDTATDAPP